MRLSDLFNTLGKDGTSSSSSFSRSYMSNTSQVNALGLRVEHMKSLHKNRQNKLRLSVTDSLAVINQPKAILFGVTSTLSQQNQQQLSSYHTQPDEPMRKQKQFFISPQLSSKQFSDQQQQQPMSTTRSGFLSPTSAASIIVKTRKVGTKEWLDMRDQLDSELDIKRPLLTSSTSDQKLSTTTTRFYPKNKTSISLKERVRNINNQFYTKFLSAGTLDAPPPQDSLEYHLPPPPTRGSKASQSVQNNNGFSQTSITSTSSSLSTRANLGLPQSPHKMMSSICIAQIKPPKGGAVKKADKIKFQNYYDSVTERLHEIKQTRVVVTGGEQSEHLHKLDFTKIKYEPVNVKKGDTRSNIDEVRRVYLNDRLSEHHANLLSAMSDQTFENPAELEKWKEKQLKIEVYTKEYKRKTFFLVKDDFGQKEVVEKEVEKENHVPLGSQRQHEQNVEKGSGVGDDAAVSSSPPQLLQMDQIEDKRNIFATGEDKAKLQLKYKKIGKEMCEILRRHYTLGLTFQEAMDQKIFLREPFKREGSIEFFRYVKSNDLEQVQKMLEKDKYLVHDFDKTLQSPLHWAAKRGYMDIAGVLLDFGAEINCTDEIGRTPLLFAYREGHNQMGKLLLMNKATPWSTKRNPLDVVIHSRISNDMTTIKIAQQIHLTMKMAKLENQAKIWEESKYLFEDKHFVRSKKKGTLPAGEAGGAQQQLQS